jgi:hypothetical protein
LDLKRCDHIIWADESYINFLAKEESRKLATVSRLESCELSFSSSRNGQQAGPVIPRWVASTSLQELVSTSLQELAKESLSG